MKKMLPVWALLGCVASAASAQSSVTLFGVMDLAARRVSNDGASSMYSMVSGANSTSRIGLRGTEDLGSGLSAGFWLEGGIAADTGASSVATQFWDREAFVTLKSTVAGELKLGRDLTPIYQVWSAADPFGQVGLGSVVSLYPAATSSAANPIFSAFGTNDRNATTTTRTNNMVSYYTPNTLGGFNATVSVAAGEGSTGTPTATTGHKFQGITLGYARGPLSVRAGFATTQTSVSGSEKFKDRSLHAIYDFGVVKASIAQRQYKYRTATENILQIGLWVPVSASGTVKASYGRMDNKGSVGAASIDTVDVRSIGIGYQHDLSKRTALYGTYARLNNGTGSSVALSGGSTSGYGAGRASKGFELGLRHQF